MKPACSLFNKRRTSALILSVLLMSGFVLSACGEKAPSDTGDSKETQEATTGQPGTELSAFEQEYEANQLPAEDFGGYEFRILARGPVNNEWTSQTITVEGQNGEVINDAVYLRNSVIEEKYNIKINWVQSKEPPTILSDLKKAVESGDDAYDLVLPGLEHASAATKQGLLLKLSDVPHINLGASWWDQSVMKDTSVMNKVYYATGEISIMDNDSTWTMMFNKQMVKDLGLENPYDLVKSGKWTLDKFTEMAKNVSKDLDGNGVFDHLDQYGFATTSDGIRGMFFSSGLKVVNKDENDVPYFALPSEDKAITALEKISYIFRGDNITMLSTDYAKVNPLTHLVIQAAFEENRALFYSEVMQCVIRLRQMDTDFGVIPLPKYDEAQEGYYTNVHSYQSEMACVPATVSDPDRTGLIVEALAMESAKYITPAYYETALKGKFVRDEESAEMLDIIFAGRTAELGYIDNYGALISDIAGQIEKKKTEFASLFDKKTTVVEKDIQKTITAYEELE